MLYDEHQELKAIELFPRFEAAATCGDSVSNRLYLCHEVQQPRLNAIAVSGVDVLVCE